MEWIKKNLWSIIGVVCGIVIIILGIVTIQADKGRLIDQTLKFGADFYTESYYATATSANNVKYLYDSICNGIGYLLLAIGLTDICLFGAKITTKKKLSDNEEVLQNETENI